MEVGVVKKKNHHFVTITIHINKYQAREINPERDNRDAKSRGNFDDHEGIIGFKVFSPTLVPFKVVTRQNLAWQ